jgi:hypothetical protein
MGYCNTTDNIEGKIRIKKGMSGDICAAYRCNGEFLEISGTVDYLTNSLAKRGITTSRLDFERDGKRRITGGLKREFRDSMRSYRDELGYPELSPQPA